MLGQIITWLALIFLILGAADYILGNKFGLGQEFERGIMVTGRLLLCIAGFIIMAPAIARTISPFVSPALRLVGADPSLFAGLILASDSGGSVLAMELADSSDAGLFNGQIVGATLGTTMMFNIPMVLQSVSAEKRKEAVYGLLIGIITIPVGCFTAGAVGKFPFRVVIQNMMPVMILSVTLMFALIFFQEKIVLLFQLWGKIVLFISTLGIVLGSIQMLGGVQIVSGMAPLEESFRIVGGICVFLAGMFPLVAVARYIFQRQFQAIGKYLRIDQNAVDGLLVTLINNLPAIASLEDMDGRSRMVNTAFLVSASFALGDHLAYSSQTAPDIIGALVIGKLMGGTAAVLTVLFVLRLVKDKRDVPGCGADGHEGGAE